MWDEATADTFECVMRAMPLVCDVLRLSMVCKEARKGLIRTNIRYSRRVELARNLVGRHIVLTSGFYALSPQETCLTFQLTDVPLRVEKVEFGRVWLEYDDVTRRHLRNLAAWWEIRPFSSEILNFSCVMHGGTPRVDDRILVIVEVRRHVSSTCPTVLDAIATLNVSRAACA